VKVRLHQELHILMQRVNQQRLIAEARDQETLDDTVLEIAKMKMMALRASVALEMQHPQLNARAGSTSDSSRLRHIAMQMLQFPVPKGCFAPCLNMADTYAYLHAQSQSQNIACVAILFSC
jgi:hypothetical protein